jgi:hypothetical protein
VTDYVAILKELICTPWGSNRQQSYITASLNEHIGFFNLAISVKVLMLTCEIFTDPKTLNHSNYLITLCEHLILLFLDLAEVMSVTPAAPAPGPPKKTDDKSFFDVSK